MRMLETTVPWLTIPAMLEANCLRFESKCALVDGEVSLSYQQLFSAVQRASCALIRSGIEPGDRIVIWGPNSWRWAVAALACWWRGAVVVPISAQAKILEGRPLIEKINPTAIFLDVASQEESIDWGGLFASCKIFSLADPIQRKNQSTEGWSTVCDGDAEAKGPAAVCPEDTCQILFTSGSTGTPKGVIRQHSQVIRNRHASSRRRGFTSDDILLGTSPFSHTLGLNGNLLRSLMLGATFVICSNPSPIKIADLIRKRGVTAMSAPPSLFNMLLNLEDEIMDIGKQLRLVSIGSAALSEQLISRLMEVGVDSISCGYGMTECDSICSATSDMGEKVITTTVGTPEDGIELLLVDQRGQRPSGGESGEILVKGYSTTPGYYNSDEDTKELFTVDGWLKTGDIGRWTPEGFLQILGRKKDVILSHGYTLFPAEIEDLMLKSNMLKSIGVFGVEHPLAGEVCVGAVVPHDAAIFEHRKLLVWARKNITRYKVPAIIYVVDQLPTNTNGKLDRRKLRQQCASRTHE
ncbi:MAG: acyl-CoA synthetase (AMP-forming)/AMP-acid ligase II [Halioglobus sp.]|jgi:acyl-CoA synthetase (AMP-forming)/AMP-acid ligase II